MAKKSPEEIKEARLAGLRRYQEQKRLEKEGLSPVVPDIPPKEPPKVKAVRNLYSTICEANYDTRQKVYKLVWNVGEKEESIVIRDERSAKSAFLTAIWVLESLGYKEDAKVKAELTPSGWYFKI